MSDRMDSLGAARYSRTSAALEKPVVSLRRRLLRWWGVNRERSEKSQSVNVMMPSFVVWGELPEETGTISTMRRDVNNLFSLTPKIPARDALSLDAIGREHGISVNQVFLEELHTTAGRVTHSDRREAVGTTTQKIGERWDSTKSRQFPGPCVGKPGDSAISWLCTDFRFTCALGMLIL